MMLCIYYTNNKETVFSVLSLTQTKTRVIGALLHIVPSLSGLVCMTLCVHVYTLTSWNQINTIMPALRFATNLPILPKEYARDCTRA